MQLVSLNQQKQDQQKWLKPVIAQGIAGLMALRLNGSPSEDLAVKTAEIWLLAITKKRLHGQYNCDLCYFFTCKM